MGHEVAHARQNQGQTRQRATKELQEEYADTFGDYSSEGMQFSGATYANVNLNNNKPIIPRKARSQSDIKRLNTNTNELIKDVDKASGGNGRVDPMMSAGAYEAIELDAKNGNKASQLFLELAKENPDPKIINKLKEQLPPEAVKQVMEISEEEINSITVEKDIAQAIVEIAKVVVGVDDLKDAVATILEDKFLDAAISTAMLIAKPLKGFKYVDDVTLLLDKTGDKVVEFAGKFYGKSKKGELVEIEVASAKRDNVKISSNTNTRKLEVGGVDTTNNKNTVIGPNGGKGKKTGKQDKDGNDIIKRDSGSHYVNNSKIGKQEKINSPSKHGNTLNDTPAECYGLYCRDTGKVKKIGETTHGEAKYGAGNQKRYTKDYLKDNNVRYKKTSTGTKRDMYDKQIKDLKELKDKNGKYPDMNINGR